MKWTALTILLILSITAGAQSPYDLDRKLGKENAALVEFQFGILDDAERTAYIASVGNRLVDALDTTYFPFSFQIVPTIEPNAFALPGGYCYVTTGLLELLTTEEELACVLAHEIIHAQNRHGVKLQKKGILPALLSIPGNILGVFNDDLGALVNAPINASGALVMAKYGRGFETEADTEGVKLAAKAGYDPAALISALQKLSEVVQLATGHVEERSYLNDHPITADRVKRIEGMLEGLRVEPIAPLGALNETVDGLLVGAPIEYGRTPGDTTILLPAHDVSIALEDGFQTQVYASAVMAANEKSKSALALGRLPDTTTLEATVRTMRQNLKELPEGYLLADEDITLGGFKGHRIIFIDPSSRNRSHYYLLWIRTSEGVLQIVGLAPDGYTGGVERAMASLRPLNDREKSKMTQRFMVIEKAQNGENLEAVSVRTKNTMTPEMTALINKRPQEEILPEGAEIRVVILKPYF